MRTKDNITLSSLGFALVDLIGNVLFWPLWWYSKGLAKIGLFCLKELQNQYEQLALGVWLHNLLVPMFGQYDLEGRIISFFIRLFQIIVRTILLLVWLILLLALLVGWIILPLYIFYQFIANFLWLL